MPPEIKRLVDQFLHQPKTVQIARRNSTAKTVRQRIARVPSSDAKLKRTALRWIIDQEEVDSGIIFCNRKRDVDIVAKSLTKHGKNAEPIHGDLPQSVRTKTLDKFKSGDIKYLVASDVAARGLDVASVSHVFNYDVPFHSEDYIHRIGRTGRAGRNGDAIMLVAPLDDKNYESILDLTGKDAIEELEIPDIDNFPRERRGGKGRSGRGRSNRASDKDKSGSRSESRSSENSSKPKKSRRRPAAVERESLPEEVQIEETEKTSRTRRAPTRKKKANSEEVTTKTEAPKKTSDKAAAKKSSKPSAHKEEPTKKTKSKTIKNKGFEGEAPAFFNL